MADSENAHSGVATRGERLAAGPAPIAVRGTKSIAIKVELLTPIFGGGVEPKTADPVTPIRGSAIRGQLRFWWRATRGGEYGTLQELHAAETKLWGAASQPGTSRRGLVDVTVDARGVSVAERDLFERYQHDGRWRQRPAPGNAELAYLGFALQASEAGLRAGVAPSKLLEVRGAFEVRCSLHPNADQAHLPGLEAALWAWRHFGGVGGRTRRGFGAVSLLAEEGDLGAIGSILQSGHLVDRRPPAGVPSLAPSAGAQLVIAPVRTTRGADAAWESLARAYRAFRQGEGLGRNPGQENRPGRSRWPEADLARSRSLTGRGSPRHAQSCVNVEAAPRAAFGMPIILHFKDQGDPSDVTLKPVNKERLASPLVLRPIGSRENAAAAALLLGNRTDLDRDLGVVAEWSGGKRGVRTALTKSEADWKNSPLRGEPCPLVAFLRHLSG